LNSGSPRNIAASIRQKLLNIATRNREDFGLILTRYAPERLLYRLSQCLAVFRELCGIRVPANGIIFSAETASTTKIKIDQQYEGVPNKIPRPPPKRPDTHSGRCGIR
jgi:hypothetical protein